MTTSRHAHDDLHCVVEVPKGRRNKYAWDPVTGRIKLDRFLFTSVAWPTDYGYFADTLAEDGDPLDAMVCVSEPTFPGCYIAVEPLGLLRLHAMGTVDDKVLCVPTTDPNWSWMARLDDVPAQLRDEIAHFFEVYRQPEGHEVEVEGWLPRDEAEAVIEDARRRFLEESAPEPQAA